MILRRATSQEALSIAKVHVDSWQAAYQDILPASVLDNLAVQDFADRWQQRLEDKTHITLVCEIGNHLAGFTRFGPTRDADDDARFVGELYAIYVAPAYWGQGVGHALWLESLRVLAAHSFAEVTVWVLEENARARRFYERAGFALESDMVKLTELYGVVLPEVRYRIGLENRNNPENH